MTKDLTLTDRTSLAVLIVYYLTLVATLVASFSPENRIWGINWWAYFPGYIPAGLFVMGVLAPLSVRSWLVRRASDSDDPGRSYGVTATVFVIVFALAFVLFRVQTHFLGDGYQLLTRLADRQLVLKAWDVGTATLLQSVFDLLPGDAGERALLSYRLVSMLSGLGFLIVAALTARRLFRQTVDRMLFQIGLSCGGYALMFFGYVENYAPFIFSIGTFVLLGLVIIEMEASRWWLILPAGVASSLHVFGLALVPPLVYMLLLDRPPGKWLSGLNRTNKLVMLTILVVMAVGSFCWLRSTSYFVHLATLSFSEDILTVEGYTLFSLNHLADMVNLLLLCMPALPVAVIYVIFSPPKSVARKPQFMFLMLCMSTTMIVAFAFNPALGMPRDWDLFSFSGVPLVIGFFFLLLSASERPLQARMVAGLAIVLGFLTLGPRVASQVVDEIAIAHLNNYIRLDPVKNRFTRFVLSEYYLAKDDKAKAAAERTRWATESVEKQEIHTLQQLILQRRYPVAVSGLYRIIRGNPASVDAWGHLAECYYGMKQYDSMLVAASIAEGLNPYNAATLTLIGLAQFHRDDYEEAEGAFLRAVEIDSTLVWAWHNLTRLYEILGQPDEYVRCLTVMASSREAKPEWIQELGDHYIEIGNYGKARETYLRAVSRGMDTAYFLEQLHKWPELGG